LHLKKQTLKTGFHFIGARFEETMRFQAMGKLNSTCTAPTAVVQVLVGEEDEPAVAGGQVLDGPDVSGASCSI
jgi:hypothetical protein